MSIKPEKRLRRARRYGALLTAGLLLGTMIPSATAGLGGLAVRTVLLTEIQKFGGQNWRVSLSGVDFGTTDSVSVSLSRTTKKKKDGKIVERSTETQTFSYSGLTENTVVIKNNLTGSIDLGNQLPGHFTADVDFVADGAVTKTCNGNNKRRPVKAQSSMSLKTGNSKFGTLKNVPNKGAATSSTGNCPGPNKFPCPAKGKSASGFGTMDDGSSFSWSGNRPNRGRLGTISTFIGRPIDGTDNHGNWSAQLFSQVLKSKIAVADNLSAASVNGNGVARLDGTAQADATEAAENGAYSDCGKGKKTRGVTRTADQSGNFKFSPTGTGGAGVEGPFTFESSTIRKTEVKDK